MLSCCGGGGGTLEQVGTADAGGILGSRAGSPETRMSPERARERLRGSRAAGTAATSPGCSGSGHGGAGRVDGCERVSVGICAQSPSFKSES